MLVDDIFADAYMPARRNELVTLGAVFKALADPTRLRIAHLLSAGEVCVCNVHDALGISQPKVSRHLAYLRRAGVVTTRRDGRWIYYRLSSAIENPLVEQILDATAKGLRSVPLCTSDRKRLGVNVICAQDVGVPVPKERRARTTR